MLKLPRLPDISRFCFNDDIRDEFFFTEDEVIKCNGVLLAARSAKLEGLIRDSENIRASEFSDNLPALNDYLSLIYGAKVSLNSSNCKSIFKFGKIFQIKVMMEGTVSWISKEMPYDVFWKEYLDMATLTEPSKSFVSATERYVSTRYSDLLPNALKICKAADENTIKAIVELLPATGNISCDSKITFFLIF